MTLVNISDFRNNLADYLDLVRINQQSINLVRRGKIIAQVKPKSEKENYIKALQKAAGTFSAKKHPEWKNIAQVIKWLKTTRQKAERY